VSQIFEILLVSWFVPRCVTAWWAICGFWVGVGGAAGREQGMTLVVWFYLGRFLSFVIEIGRELPLWAYYLA
jgi:hypothetical protein